VEPGTYAVVPSAGRASETAAREIHKLEIVRQADTATLTLADGSDIARPFTPRERGDWPAGCPTNVNNTRMEVLDLGQEPLTIGPLTFTHPLIVRDCPPTPEHVVLHDAAGAIGGSGTACAGTDECITFAPGVPPSTQATPPTTSMKGYELYSWSVGQEWRFTLIDGTDRVKTYEEVTDGESGMAGILINGTVEDLLIALEQLPAGAHVFWRSASALEQIGMEPHDLALPPQPLMNDVTEHAEANDLQLDVLR
jgi:hypothetical protein